MEEIIKNIKIAKEKSGKKWSEILRSIGWERSTLSLILNNKRRPRIDTLQTLAQGIGCELIEFFGSKSPIEYKIDMPKSLKLSEEKENPNLTLAKDFFSSKKIPKSKKELIISNMKEDLKLYENEGR